MEQISLSTAEDAQNYFLGDEQFEDAMEEMSPMPGGVYRVVEGKLYQVLPDEGRAPARVRPNEMGKIGDRIEELENMLFERGAMEDPPCFRCGYNGPGYFRPKTHPCAERHHKMREKMQNEERM